MGMQTSTRWPAALVATALLVVVVTCAVAWQLLRQERELERQQRRERLENAASLVVRESERAWEQAGADPQSSLSLAWDESGVHRTAGVPLVWSPRPVSPAPLPREPFAEAEILEFGQRKPAQALARYTALLADPNADVRAGALMRIARCQRTLGRVPDALDTYSRLAALGAARLPGATAAMVGHHERAALFDAAGDARAAHRERERLRELLEQAPAALDRATFAFYGRAAGVNPRAIAWAKAAEELMARVGEATKGADLFDAGGATFIGTWERNGSGGSGRLVRFDGLCERVERALAGSSANWRLAVSAGVHGGPASLFRRPAETGLPWGVLVSLPAGESSRRVLLLTAGIVLAGLTILCTLLLAYRTVRRELRVAEMQSEFVAAVSHEFRSPITALTHLTELLASGETPEERRPLYYQALARETRRLRDMVENLLDFGRMEAGRYRYRPERLDAAAIAFDLLEEFRAQPAAHGHAVLFEEPPSAVPLVADREALRRAFWNLLENAAKYSPAGTTIIARVSANAGEAVLSVQDEGPGIPPDERKRIFQKFVRGGGVAESQVKGTGIGLAMVDAIARAHGGRVELESRPGAGSRFALVLPLKGSQ